MRLSESLYTVKSIDEHGMHLDKLNRLVGFAGTENSCLPAGIYEAKQFNATGKHERDSNRSMNSTLSGCSMYVDSDVSEELRNKVEFWVFCQNNLINFGSENRGHLALVLAVDQSHTLISCVNVRVNKWSLLQKFLHHALRDFICFDRFLKQLLTKVLHL